LLQAVAALREADRARIERAEVAAREEAAIGRPPALAPMDPAGVLVVLREAAALRRSLWIGYVDSAGRADRRLVDPLSVEAGRISVFDRGARELRSLSVHRVVGVAPATTAEP
jgi:predicted DNA-binding transcriptional regulator YafY